MPVSSAIPGWAKAIREQYILAVLSFVVIAGVVYGPFLRSTGFYWDDWPIVWVYKSFGSTGLNPYFAGNHPVWGWLFTHLFPVLGTRPVAWQLLSVAIRCASSIALFFTFCKLWPQRRDAAWAMGAILLLYPGFTQQPIALTYFPIHLSFLLFVASLLASMFAVTSTRYRWPLFIVALLAEIVSYSIAEFFIGLEFLRPFALYALLPSDANHGFRKRSRAAAIWWMPYALFLAMYAVWRAFLFRGDTNHPLATKQILASPAQAIWKMLGIGIHNILVSGIFAWARPFDPEMLLGPLRSILVFWVPAAIVGVLATYALRRFTSGEAPVNRIPRIGLLLAVVGMLTAGLPFLFTSDTLRANFTGMPAYDDRMTLPFMPASCLLLVVLVDKTRRAYVPVMVTILCVIGAFQAQNENAYRHDWLEQRSLFWQMAWRAPALKKGTSVFVAGLPKSIYRNHNAGMLDLLYGQGSGRDLTYFMFDLNKYPQQRPLNFRLGQPTDGNVRQFEFQGSTAQSLVWWISPEGTLRIVSPSRAGEILRCPMLCSNLAQLSDPRDIITDAPTLPSGPLLMILGPPPPKYWLYYFQKASLANQLGQWDAVAALGDTARSKGYEPTDSSEWFPFIEGYAKAHRTESAIDITRHVLADSPSAMTPLSALWRDVIQESTDVAEIDLAYEALRGNLDLAPEQNSPSRSLRR